MSIVTGTNHSNDASLVLQNKREELLVKIQTAQTTRRTELEAEEKKAREYQLEKKVDNAVELFLLVCKKYFGIASNQVAAIVGTAEELAEFVAVVDEKAAKQTRYDKLKTLTVGVCIPFVGLLFLLLEFFTFNEEKFFGPAWEYWNRRKKLDKLGGDRVFFRALAQKLDLSMSAEAIEHAVVIARNKRISVRKRRSDVYNT